MTHRACESSFVGVRVPLSCLLVRPNVTDPRETLTTTAKERANIIWYLPTDDGRFERASDHDVASAETSLVLRAEAVEPQPWEILLEAYLRVDGFHAGDRESTGAVLFIRVPEPGATEGRLVVWTFGTGHYLVRNAAVDPRFGLLAVLNRLSDPEVDNEGAEGVAHPRGVTLARLNTHTGPLRRAALVAATPTRADRLGRIDTTTDSLASVTGRTGAGSLSRLSGGRAMRQDAFVRSLDELRTYSGDALQRRRETKYRAEYEWIDRWVPEEDEEVVEQVLEAVCAGETQSGDPASIEVLWDDEIGNRYDDRPLHHFLWPGERTNKGTMLTWASVRNWLAKNRGRTLRDTLAKELRFYDERDNKTGSCPILELLTGEVWLDGTMFVLSDGTVWRVNGDFVKAVDEDLTRRMRTTDLPRYEGGGENAYNLLVKDHHAWRDRVVLLHERMFRLEAQTPVEFCDLLVADGTLIHVKLKGRSSALSYLAEQTVVSARLLRREAKAREALQLRVLDAGGDDALIMRFWDRIGALAGHDHRWRVIFAIVGGWREPVVSALPLFGRIIIRDACQHLEDLGFEPWLALVGSTVDKPGNGDPRSGAVV